MTKLERVIRDLKTVEKTYGDPNLNNGFDLFAAQTARDAASQLEKHKPVEAEELPNRMGFKCGHCKGKIQKAMKCCPWCEHKIYWKKNEEG
jgi:hypothetical protein